MDNILTNKLNDLIDTFDSADADDLKKFSVNLESGINTSIITESINDLEKLDSSFDFEPESDYNDPFDKNLKNKIEDIINEKKMY